MGYLVNDTEEDETPPEHGETDDKAPPQWDDQPAREGGHDE